MKNFNKGLKSLGLVFIFVGIFIIIAQPFSVTGAVIDISTAISRIWFFVGLGLLIIGSSLVGYTGSSNNLESKANDSKFVPAPEFFARINKKEPDAKKRYLILDTSAILLYTPEQMERKLQEYENVFVPDLVLDEIADENMKKIIATNTEEIEGFEEYRKIARRYLQRTEKPEIRRLLHPYLTKKKQINTHSVQTEINKKSYRLRKIIAEEDGIDLTGAKMVPNYALGKVEEQLKKHCKVSKTDIDALATAMKIAKSGYHAIIGEKDIDFRQAIELIKEEDPELGKNMDFVEPYKKEYVSSKK